MVCYCANYYSAQNCHNPVPNFGDRCAYCKSNQVNAEGSEAMQKGILQANERWVENSKREEMKKDEDKNKQEKANGSP